MERLSIQEKNCIGTIRGLKMLLDESNKRGDFEASKKYMDRIKDSYLLLQVFTDDRKTPTLILKIA